jgi:hypothetical protein
MRCLVEGVFATDGGGHLIALPTEQLRQIVAQLIVVIDEKQFDGGSGVGHAFFPKGRVAPVHW